MRRRAKLYKVSTHKAFISYLCCINYTNNESEKFSRYSSITVILDLLHGLRATKP